MFLEPRFVMLCVDDVAAAQAWYARWLEQDLVELAPDYWGFRVGGVELCFHAADAKVPAGAAGTVTYWGVASVPAALARAEALGGRRHRGPLAIEDGRAMCQVLDPFGNLFGMVGAA